MPLRYRIAAALFALAMCLGLTCKVSRADLYGDALKCLGNTEASDTTKLDCLTTVQTTVAKDPLQSDKAYAPLVRMCFKDPSFFVRLAAARVVARIHFNRNAFAPEELTLYLDPKIIGSKECLNESAAMAAHLRLFQASNSFATMEKLGMIATVWNTLLNGPTSVQKDVLASFYPMLGGGSQKELAPYRDNAEKYFDWLFTPAASALDAEDLITVSIDQAATILFAMGDTVFVGRHLLTPIGSWVLYPNAKSPNALSPDARWGYADDLNAELRPRLPINLKFDKATLKVWADALQVLIISQTPIKNARGCIDRATAVDNVSFGGPQLESLVEQTLAELASEEPHGKDFGQETKGCGELEARAMFEHRSSK